MELLGHTMATPTMTLADALTLFADLGLDGAEVIWQDDYPAAIAESDPNGARAAAALAHQSGVPIRCLTPYMSQINSLDPNLRGHELDRWRRCIDAAATVGASYLRVYAGSVGPDSTAEERERRWDLLVDALRSLSGPAAGAGVSLCVENHFGTMAMSASEARALMLAVDDPAVGVVYDQANLTFTHQEAWPEALQLQSPWIRYVQAKDLVFTDPDRPFRASAVHRVSQEERAVQSRVVGEGILDWPAILAGLVDCGFSGPVSFEYEARWHPQDLPPAEVGLARSVTLFRRCLADLEAA